jgi:hypothetical protein
VGVWGGGGAWPSARIVTGRLYLFRGMNWIVMGRNCGVRSDDVVFEGGLKVPGNIYDNLLDYQQVGPERCVMMKPPCPI